MILVTGGAKKLGAAIVRALAREGEHCLIHYRTSQSEAEALAQETGSEIIQGDFSSLAGVEQFCKIFFSRFSSVRGIVHNVGNYEIAAPSALHVQQWEALFQTNLLAPVAITNALLPTMVRGAIVMIGATALCPQRADSYSTAYTASKLALWEYMRSLALEVAPRQINVNMVSPGYVVNSIDQSSKIPMGRAVSHAEVARSVAFFMNPQNVYITGQNLEIAGGTRL